MDDIALSFDDEVYDYIVEVALDYSLGARGLRSVREAILTDHMFDAPGMEENPFTSPRSMRKRRLNEVAGENFA